MKKVIILYYSRTGNTEKMARVVLEGVRSVGGVEGELTFSVKPEYVSGIDGLVIGMPTYYHDMTKEVKTLLEEVAVKGVSLKGKVGTTFGSYGWSGEAPGLILEIMHNKFEMKVLKPPLLAKYTPDSDLLEECNKLGRQVAEEVSRL